MNIFKTKRFILTTLIFAILTTLSFGMLQVFHDENVKSIHAATVTPSSLGEWNDEDGDGIYTCSLTTSGAGILSVANSVMQLTLSEPGLLKFKYSNTAGQLEIKQNGTTLNTYSGNVSSLTDGSISLTGSDTIEFICTRPKWKTEGTANVGAFYLEQTMYNVQASANDDSLGSVTFTNGEYMAGTNLTVTASPNSGTMFFGFADETKTIVSTNTTYSFAASKATTLTALFGAIKGSNTEENPYSLTDIITTMNTYLAEGTVLSYSQTNSDVCSDYYFEAANNFSVLLNDVEQTATNGIYHLSVDFGANTVKFVSGTQQYVYTITNPGLAGTTISKGSGTTDDPYLIEKQSDFAGMRNNLGLNFRLAEDIELTGKFAPIGDVDNPFTGTFDGYGHKIIGMTIDGGEYRGLFATTKGATIKDLELTEIKMTNIGANSSMFIGNATSTTVKNISVSGSLEAVASNIGGLLGYTKDSAGIKATNCVVSGKIYTTGDGNIGGFTGAGGRFTKCIMDADVTGVHFIGGFTGGASVSSTFTDCEMTGSVAMINHHSGNYPYWGLISGYGASNSYSMSNSGQKINFKYRLDESKHTVSAIHIFNSNLHEDGLAVDLPQLGEDGKYSFSKLVPLSKMTALDNAYNVMIKDEITVNGIMGNYGGFTIRFTMSNGTYKYISTLNKTKSVYESDFDINLDDLTSYENNFNNITIDNSSTSAYGTAPAVESKGYTVWGTAPISNANDFEHLAWVIKGGIPTTFANCKYNARTIITLSILLTADIDLQAERTLSSDSSFILNRKGHTSNGTINQNFFGLGNGEMHPYRGSLHGGGHSLTVNMDFEDDEAYCFGIICVATDEVQNIKVTDITIYGAISGRYRVGIVGMNDNYTRDFTLTFKNVTNYANITAKSFVGAFVGEAQGYGSSGQTQVEAETVLENCINYGTITATAGNAGGLVGNFNHLNGHTSYALVTFKNCANHGDVHAIGGYAGGFVAGINNVITIEGTNINSGIVTSTKNQANFYVGNIGSGTFSTTDNLRTNYQVNLNLKNVEWTVEVSGASIYNSANELVTTATYTTNNLGILTIPFANLQTFAGVELKLHVPYLINAKNISLASSNTDSYYNQELETYYQYQKTMATSVLVPIDIEICDETTNDYETTASDENWVIKANVFYNHNLENQTTNVQEIELYGMYEDKKLETYLSSNKLVFKDVYLKHDTFKIPETEEFIVDLLRITYGVENYVDFAYSLIQAQSGTNAQFKKLGNDAKSAYDTLKNEFDSYSTEDQTRFSNYIKNEITNIKGIDASYEVLLPYYDNIADSITASEIESINYGNYEFDRTVVVKMLSGREVSQTLTYSFQKTNIDENFKVTATTDGCQFKVGEVVTCSYNEPIEITVNKVDVGIKFTNNTTAIYNGEKQTIQSELILKDEDVGLINHELSYNGAEDAVEANTYVVALESLIGDNARFYNIPENLNTGTLIINKLQYTLNYTEGYKREYNGAEPSIADLSIDNEEPNDSAADIKFYLTQNTNNYNLTAEDYAVSYSGTLKSNNSYKSTDAITQAGTYTITITILNDNNLEIVGENSFNFEISQKKITKFEILSDLNYNGATKTLEFGFEEKVGDDTFSVAYNTYYGGEAAAIKNAGGYSVEITDLGNANYTFQSLTDNFVIKQAEITLNLLGQSSTYGDELNFDAEKYEVQGTVYTPDDLGIVLSTTAKNLSPVGSYPISYTMANGNYIVTNTPQANYVINTRKADLAVVTTTYNYQAKNLYSEIETEWNDMLATEECNILPKDIESFKFVLVQGENSTTEFRNVGSYTLKLDQSETYENVLRNYHFDSTEQNLTIVNTILTIKPKDIQISYSEEIIFTNEITGLISPDTLNSVVIFNYVIKNENGEITSTPDIGTYVIEIEITNNNLANSGNYEVKLQTGTLVVTQRQTHIEAQYITSKIYDGKEVKLNGKLVDKDNKEIEGAKITYEITLNGNPVEKILNAGEYSVKVKGDAGDNNTTAEKVYTIQILTNEITVTVNLESNSKVYDEQEFTFTDSIVAQENVDVSGIVGKQILNENKEPEKAIEPGKYSIVYTVDDENNNFTLSQNISELHITKIKLKLDIDDVYIKYGDTVNLTELAPKFDKEISISKKPTVTFDVEDYDIVGDYNFSASWNYQEYFDITFDGAQLHVEARPLELIYSGTEVFDYNPNGYEDLLSVRVENALSSEAYNISYEQSGILATVSNAGTYALVVRIKDTTNYIFKDHEGSVVSKTITINQKALTLNIQVESKTYDGEDIKVEVYVGDALLDKDLHIVKFLTGGEPTSTPQNAGNYQVEVVETDPLNYVFSETTKSFSIHKRAITIDSIQDEYLYVRDQIKPTLDLNNMVEGKEVDLDVEYVQTEGNFTEVGTYTINILGISGVYKPNYELKSSSTLTYKIIPTLAKVAIKNNEFVFTNEQLKQNQLEMSFNCGIDVLTSDFTISTLPRYVGEYTISITSKNTGISFDISEFKVKITAAEMTGVDFIGKTVDFNNQVHSLKVAQTTLSNGLPISVEYSENAYVNAGMYEVTATVTNENYKPLVLKATLVINQIQITVELSKNMDFVYNQQNQGLEILRLNSLWYNQLITYKYVGTNYSSMQKPINAGEYSLEISSNNENNIKILNPLTSFEIKTKAVSITSTQEQIKIYNAKPQVFDLTYSGVYPDESVEIEVLYDGELDAPVDVATYVVRFNKLTGIHAHNYHIKNTNPESKLTINPYFINVVANNVSVTYGEPSVDLTYTSDDLLGNDQFSGSIIREQGNHVSSYRISQGTLTAGKNYEIKFTTAIYNITQREIGFKTFETSYVYNGKSQIPSVEITNVVAGDGIVAKIETNGDTINVGTYELKAVITNPNYKLPSKSTFSIEISKLEMTEKIIGLIINNIDYSGLHVEPMVMIDGDYDYVLSYKSANEDVEEMINAGSYKVTVALDDRNIFGSKTFEFRINKINHDSTVLQDLSVEIFAESFNVVGRDDVLASIDNVSFESNSVLGLQNKTTYNIYVKVLEDENHNTTSFLLGEFTTCPSSNVINDFAEEVLNKEIEADDIQGIKDIIKDYNNLTSGEKTLLDQDAYEEMIAEYEEYFNQVNSEVVEVKIVSDIVDFGANTKIRKLSVAVYALGFGLIFMKKRKEDNESNN